MGPQRKSRLENIRVLWLGLSPTRRVLLVCVMAPVCVAGFVLGSALGDLPF